MYVYQVFGLRVACDIPMPELLPINVSHDAADVVIQAGEVPSCLNTIENVTSTPLTFSSSSTQTDPVEKMPALQGQSQRLLLNIDSIARFLIQYGREIIYKRYAGVDADSLRLFILGSCLGAVLQQRGYIVLHGNAVTTNHETCTIFVGHTGAGKSTTAARYVQLGAFFLADDVCAITFNEQGMPLVIPSFPQIKLWQDAADLLGISTVGLRRIRPQDLKFAYRIEQQFCAQPLPLKRIVEVTTIDNVESTCVQSSIEKLRHLIVHSYRHYYLQPMQLSNHYGKLLIKLMGRVELLRANRNDVVKLGLA